MWSKLKELNVVQGFLTHAGAQAKKQAAKDMLVQWGIAFAHGEAEIFDALLDKSKSQKKKRGAKRSRPECMDSPPPAADDSDED